MLLVLSECAVPRVRGRRQRSARHDVMQQFFHELKRRGVGRVALAYVAASWLLVQIMETVFPLYELDDGYIRIVILVLAVGFVPALGLAWAFEWSPGGLRTQAAIDRDPSAAQSDGRLLDRAIIVVLSIAVLLFSVDKFLGSDSPGVAVTNKTIAVLPFDDLTEAGDQAYFADGLAEELLNLLARNPALRVAARTSSFSFRNAELPIDVIAERLGVQHIVEGSIRRSADRIRVTAQLIAASDGFHLWSQTYDAPIDDVFEIQSNISQQIAGALEATMSGTLEPPQPLPTLTRCICRPFIAPDRVRAPAFMTAPRCSPGCCKSIHATRRRSRTCPP